MNRIRAEIRRFVRGNLLNYLFGQPDGWLTDDTSFMDSGIAGSTGVPELIAGLGRRCSIRAAHAGFAPRRLGPADRLALFIEPKLTQ